MGLWLQEEEIKLKSKLEQGDVLLFKPHVRDVVFLPAWELSPS